MIHCHTWAPGHKNKHIIKCMNMFSMSIVDVIKTVYLHLRVFSEVRDCTTSRLQDSVSTMTWRCPTHLHTFTISWTTSPMPPHALLAPLRPLRLGNMFQWESSSATGWVVIKLFRCPGTSLLLGWHFFFQFLRDPISELVPDGNKHFYHDNIAISCSTANTCKHLVLPRWSEKTLAPGNDTEENWMMTNICL